MKFAIDAHAIGQKLTGNEVYVRNLLSCFAQADSDSDFLAYISTSDALPAIPARFRTQTVSTNPFLRLGAEIPLSLLRERPDLLHVQYTSPLVCTTPIVVSVHDVSFLEYPSYFSRARAMQLQVTVKRTVNAAARILTPSAFSRRSVAKAYQLDPDRISVIHNGVSPQFRPLPQEAAAGWLMRHKDVAWPFVLTVGDLQPRKNHLGLIKAFESVIRAHPELTHRLVFAGKDTWFSPTVRAAARASSVADRIMFLGFVSDEELVQYYSACDVFVFPSFYEGFGIPILEAMACGRAVACSNTSAMPEVADSAALLFDPTNIEQMGRALNDLLIDPQLRARMGRLGLQRSTLFHWNRAAQETLAAYYSVASESRARSMAAKSVAAPFMKFLIFCLLTLPLAAQETLRYSINWASGLSLGEATLTSSPAKSPEGQLLMNFELRMDASIPGFAVLDEFKSLASQNYCSMEFNKSLAHGKRKSKEKVEFSKGEATRKTLEGGGKTTFSTPSCPKDALTFLQYARHQVALGKVPASEPVIFGATYQVRFDYAGEQKIKVADVLTQADKLVGFVKGPKSEFTFEMFLARDPQRTPLLIKVPFTLGTFSMELVR